MHTYTNELIGKTVFTADGPAGRLKDIYFEDRPWQVKYLLIDLGRWFFDERILVAPSAIGIYLDSRGQLNTQLTKAQLKDRRVEEPPMPITRRATSLLYNYRSWPSFGRAGNGYPTLGMFKAGAGLVNNAEVVVKKELHLLGFRDVIGYELRNDKERLGLIKDLVIDLDQWCIPFLMVDDVTTSDRERVLVRSEDTRSFESHYSVLRANLSKAQFDVCPRINSEGFFENSNGRF